MWEWRLFTPLRWLMDWSRKGEEGAANSAWLQTTAGPYPSPLLRSDTSSVYFVQGFAHLPESCLIGEGHDTLGPIRSSNLLSLHPPFKRASTHGPHPRQSGFVLMYLTIPSALPATSTYQPGSLSRGIKYWKRLVTNEHSASRVESGSEYNASQNP